MLHGSKITVLPRKRNVLPGPNTDFLGAVKTRRVRGTYYVPIAWNPSCINESKTVQLPVRFEGRTVRWYPLLPVLDSQAWKLTSWLERWTAAAVGCPRCCGLHVVPACWHSSILPMMLPRSVMGYLLSLSTQLVAFCVIDLTSQDNTTKLHSVLNVYTLPMGLNQWKFRPQTLFLLCSIANYPGRSLYLGFELAILVCSNQSSLH